MRRVAAEERFRPRRSRWRLGEGATRGGVFTRARDEAWEESHLPLESERFGDEHQKLRQGLKLHTARRVGVEGGPHIPKDLEVGGGDELRVDIVQLAKIVEHDGHDEVEEDEGRNHLTQQRWQQRERAQIRERVCGGGGGEGGGSSGKRGGGESRR